MIKNEIFNGKDLPDEQHEEFLKTYDLISDALFDVADHNSIKDERLFLSALTVVHAVLVALLMESISDMIDEEEYIKKELHVFELNLRFSLNRIKKEKAKNE